MCETARRHILPLTHFFAYLVGPEQVWLHKHVCNPEARCWRSADSEFKWQGTRSLRYDIGWPASWCQRKCLKHIEDVYMATRCHSAWLEVMYSLNWFGRMVHKKKEKDMIQLQKQYLLLLFWTTQELWRHASSVQAQSTALAGTHQHEDISLYPSWLLEFACQFMAARFVRCSVDTRAWEGAECKFDVCKNKGLVGAAYSHVIGGF